MTVSGLTMSNADRQSFHNRARIAVVAVRGSRTAVCWKGFSGFCGVGPAGRTCRRNIRILRPAGGGCGIGTSRAFAERLARLSERIERTPAVKVERIGLGHELCSRAKRGC